MRLVLFEDARGEIDGLDAARLDDKLEKAFGGLRTALFKAKGRQHGEIRAMDELIALMREPYEKGLQRIRVLIKEA